MFFTVPSTKYKLPDGMKEVQGPKLRVSSYFRGRLKAMGLGAFRGVFNRRCSIAWPWVQLVKSAGS